MHSTNLFSTWHVVCITWSTFLTKLSLVQIIVSNWYSSLAVLQFVFTGSGKKEKKGWKIDLENLSETFEIKHYFLTLILKRASSTISAVSGDSSNSWATSCTFNLWKIIKIVQKITKKKVKVQIICHGGLVAGEHSTPASIQEVNRVWLCMIILFENTHAF